MIEISEKYLRTAGSNTNNSAATGSNPTNSNNNNSNTSSPPCNLQLSSSSLIAYPFVNNTYPIQIYLYDWQKKLVQGHYIPVELLLFYEGSDSPLPLKNICTYDPEELRINTLGILECNIQFQQVSMEHSNKKFVLQFRIQHHKIKALIPSLFTQQQGDDSSYYLVSTIPMLVVQRKFHIQLEMNQNTTYGTATGEDDQPSSSLQAVTSSVNYFGSTSSSAPASSNNLGTGAGAGSSAQSYIWYKDEGGKDHGIELTISLINKENLPMTGEEIPFLITLHYQNHTDSVLNQSNLYTIIPGNNHVIDKFTGKCYRKLRIHDISKNHQRQLFVIKVSPDLSKSSKYFDIAADESAPIEVRSKRSKRMRDTEIGSVVGGSAGIIGGGNAGLSGVGLAGGVNRTGSSSNISNILTVSPVNTGSATENNHYKKKSKLSGAVPSNLSVPPPPASFLLGGGYGGSGNSNGLIGSNALGKGFSIPTDFETNNEVDSAYFHISKWIDQVIHNLQLIRWKPIGFHNPHPGSSNPDHQGDPLYSIPNPNDIIDSLLSDYSDQVYHSLSVILKQHQRQKEASLSTVPNGKKKHSNSLHGGRSSNATNQKRLANSSSSGNNPAMEYTVNSSSSQSTIPATSGFSSPPPLPPANQLPAVKAEDLLFRVRADSIENQKDWKTVINYIEISESQVYYIISKPYDFQKNELLNSPSTSEMLYFPAFDIDRNLVGFYTETKDQKNSTIILFIPINSPIISPDLINLQTAKQILEEKLYQSNNPLELHSLNQKDNNYDLESLKHNAIVHYWFSEIGLDDF